MKNKRRREEGDGGTAELRQAAYRLSRNHSLHLPLLGKKKKKRRKRKEKEKKKKNGRTEGHREAFTTVVSRLPAVIDF